MRRIANYFWNKSHTERSSAHLQLAMRHARYTFRKTSAADTTSAAHKERRANASKWETAVFGKMFYEAGSREKFNAATERDEQEEHRLRELQQEATMNADRQGMEPSSSCPLGTEAPPYNPEMSAEEMKLQPLPIVKRHIVSLLVRGENRLLNAPDYGSYLMMGHMHVGYAMIDDAEALLRHFGLMTEAMEESIEDLRHKAREIQQDLDLTD